MLIIIDSRFAIGGRYAYFQINKEGTLGSG